MEFVPLKIISELPLAVALKDGQPVVLETRARCSVYLGALLDGMGEAKNLVEIWTQDFSRDRDALTMPVLNVVADRQWESMVEGFAKGKFQKLWRGPWESSCCGAEVVGEDDHWKVCEDPDLLRKKELPTYAESEFRYLVSEDGKSFVALSPEAPLGPGVKPVDDFFESKPVINREGGRMMIREAAPFHFGGLVEFIQSDKAGALRESLRIPSSEFEVGKILKDGGDRSGAGFIHGRAAPSDRLAEILFLKLCSLRGAMAAVRDATQELRTPFGGLSEDSFAAEISPTDIGLPFLWTQQIVLVDAPRFAPFSLGSRKEEFPLAIAPETGSIYSPPWRFQATNGMGRMHLKQVTLPDDAGLVVISGNLRTSEPLESSRKDMMRLQFPVPGGKRFEFYATLEGNKGDGEWRFVSYPVELPENFSAEEIGENGMFFERVNFDLFPGVGSTRDLYSLGVLAFRVMFSCGGAGLSERLDEFQAMLRGFSGSGDVSEWTTGTGRLLDFIKSPVGEKWLEPFGPQHVAQNTTPAIAADAIPQHLWWNIVSWIGQLLPGSMQGSYARDFDHFDRRALHMVYESPLDRLDDLIDQARLLIFGDPSVNRDLLRVIQGVRDRT